MDSRDSGLPETNNSADEPGSRSISSLLASPRGIHAPRSTGFNRPRLLSNPRLVLRILALDGDRGRLQILGKMLDECRLEGMELICKIDAFDRIDSRGNNFRCDLFLHFSFLGLSVTRCQVDSAVTVLTRNKDEFDVVFSNVRLPCPDGSELLSQISVNVGIPVLSKP